MSNTKAIELAAKLKKLVEAGVGGEAVNAAIALERLMKKHGITEDDLRQQVVRTYSFKFKGAREKLLLLQVAFKVCVSAPPMYSITRGGRMVPVRSQLIAPFPNDWKFNFFSISTENCTNARRKPSSPRFC